MAEKEELGASAFLISHRSINSIKKPAWLGEMKNCFSTDNIFCFDSFELCQCKGMLYIHDLKSNMVNTRPNLFRYLLKKVLSLSPSVMTRTRLGLFGSCGDST